ncbi:hypothetical protein NLI96_g12461 [Meripilus lineatus]|uniref:Peroxisomal membrane protein PEX16 n=1 Tax=Meripilus lineatus TaxID=2056292 RepID=A0AAD5UR88_9APHY|nr:hypothetical protein NLI96_g12461 [Physisporinus lineatus]
MHSDPKYKPIIPPSYHARYTRAWSDSSFAYKWASRALQLIQYVELVVEMGLKRRTADKTRWRAIVMIEAIKAALRLVLLKITRRPLVSPLVPEREFDPSALPAPSEAASSPTLAPSSPPSSLPATPEHLRNNHVPLPPHPILVPPPPTQSPVPVEEFLLPKALTISSVKSPTHLIKLLNNPKDWLAELIYTLRPLIYGMSPSPPLCGRSCLSMPYVEPPVLLVVAIMLARDKKSTRPLITALALEFLSRNLRRVPSSSATLERSEYARRDRDIVWYLLRGSIWESWTRPKVEAVLDSTARAPLFGVFSVLMKDWIPLIDEYYYYTAP